MTLYEDIITRNSTHREDNEKILSAYDKILKEQYSLNENSKPIAKAVFTKEGRKIQGTRTGKLQLGFLNDDDTIDIVTAKQFLSSSLPWVDNQQDDDNYFKKEFLMALLKKEKHFGRKVDYNKWVRNGNPTFEEKLGYILKNMSVKYTKTGV